MSDVPHQPAKSRRQTAAFAVVCLCVVAARVYLATINGTDSQLGWRLPEASSQTATLIALACVLSALAAWLGRKYFNKTAAILMAAAAGGLSTAGYNGLIGTIPGGIVGLLVASHIARRIALALLAAFSALAFGVASGTLALWLDPDLSDGPCFATILAAITAFVVATIAVFWRRQSIVATPWRRRLRSAARVGLVSLIVLGLWLSLSADLIRRARGLSPGLPCSNALFFPPVAPYWVERRPISAEWLWKGPVRLGHIFFVIRADATDDDLRALRGWTELRDVMIQGDNISDAGLHHFKGLTGLYGLKLSSSRITDRGVSAISNLPVLQQLQLDRSQVTANGLRQLSSLPKLWQLSFKDVRLGDDDLAALQLCGSVNSLSLSGTDISDAGLHYLVPLRLSDLDVSRTKVTAQGLQVLRDKSLRSLNLAGTGTKDKDIRLLAELSIAELTLDATEITGKGVQRMVMHSNVRALSLRDTNVTDTAIRHLEALTWLRFLDICGTKVTREGVMRFRASNPNCVIAHDQKLFQLPP
jgi:hypothetical protein